MGKKILLILLVIIILGGGFIFFKKRNAANDALAGVTPVKMIEAKLESLTTTVSADGTVNTKEERDIKARLDGLIEEIYVENGDQVIKGDKIFKLDENLLRESLETARLNLEESQRSYQNLLDTYNNQENLNKLKLKEAKHNLEIALLSLENEKISLKKQREKAEEKLRETEEELHKAGDKLKESEYLYQNNAITLHALKEAKEAYQQAEENYRQAKNELEVLTEKTIPNALQLAQLKVDNARNQLNLLQASIERDRITENDLELSRIKIAKAENQVKIIKENLNKIVTYAPISGTITSLKIEIGDKVVEGTTVGQVANIDELIIEAMVDEVDINEVSLDQQVIITSDAFEQVLDGRVTWIAPVGTKIGNINKYKTEIEVVDTKGLIRPGMFVNCEIITNRVESAIILPSMAILGDEEKYVFVAKDGKAEKRPVEIGLKSISKVEVNGVELGEKVIIGPFTALKKLKPGMPVADIDKQKKKK